MLSQHLLALSDYVRTNDQITLRQLLETAGSDSVLLLLIILSLLNIALSPLPMNSFVIGIPLLAISALYTMNADITAYRWRYLDKRISCHAWRPYLNRLQHYGECAERWLKPRWPLLAKWENRLFTGLQLMILSLIIFLPIPFMNVPGSIGMIALALGALQRDGLFISLGYALFVLHLTGLFFITQLLNYV